MNIAFGLAPNDWSAFGEYQVSHSPTMRREVRHAQFWGLVAVVIIAVGAGWAFSSWLILAMALAGGALAIADAPRQVRGRVRRQMAALFDEGANPCARGLHRCEATERGLALRCDAGESLTVWTAIEGVVETPTHVFLLMGGARGLVVPRERVVEGALDSFTAEVRALSGHPPA